MLVLVRTLEVLLFFAALGLPVNLLLLRSLDRVSRRPGAVPLLLAPATGLALVAISTGFCYARQLPVVAAVPYLWLLLVVLWAGLLGWIRWHRGRGRAFSGPAGSVSRTVAWASPGLLLVLAAYLWPFLLQPDLVFWHYAGSDGYIYMRIAEHVASPGTGVIPVVDAYRGNAGFLAEEIRMFQAGAFTDKPGTMSTLAGMSCLLGLTPHETFAPLNAAALAIFHLVLLVFGRTLLRLPMWAAGVFAVFGALAPSVWMLGTHTFLGNVLALPFYPLALLVVRPIMRRSLAIYGGLVVGAAMVIFPDGIIALAGMLAVTVPYLVLVAARKRKLAHWVKSCVLALIATGLVIAPFGIRLLITAFGRFVTIFYEHPGRIFENMASASAAGVEPAGLQPLSSINWIWPAFNLNFIPPEPLRKAEVPYLVLLAGLLAVFVVGCIWRRCLGQLCCYLIGFALLLGFGLLGFFISDYELFRGLVVFSYLPLAAVCVLPWLLTAYAGGAKAMAWRALLWLGPATLLLHFARNDLAQFRFAFEQHAIDAQYTVANLQDRAAIARLDLAQGPLVLASETPSFTAFANIQMLFSNSRLGMPDHMRKFFFFRNLERADLAYEAPLVLRNRRYVDIGIVLPEPARFYSSTDFEVIANDLVPFFDNDSLPMTYALPWDPRQSNHPGVTRIIQSKTVVTFHLRVARRVAVELKFLPEGQPADLPYALDQGDPGMAVPDAHGLVVLPPQQLAAGLHRLEFGPLPQAAQITAFRLYDHDRDAPPERMTGQWYDTRNFRPNQLAPFALMTPQPRRFYSSYGPAINGDRFNAHPLTRLRFQVPAGQHRLRSSVGFVPAAYEYAGTETPTDGVEIEVAVITPDEQRTVVYTRAVDPLNVPADRGELPIDVPVTVAAGEEIELSINPGRNDRNNRDWIFLGKLVIE